MHFSVFKLRKSDEKSLNSDLQWLGRSLGLFGERDKEKSCFRVFLELIKANKRRKPISSDEIALRANLARGTVVHHLHKLISSGLIISENNKYLLRESNIEDLIIEMRKDMLRIMQDMQDVAQEIDEELGLSKKQRKESTIQEQ